MSMRRTTGFVTLGLGVLLSLGACGRSEQMDAQEVARATSPDGRIDVVLTEHNPGATASFVYRVYLLPRDSEPTDAEPAAELYGATRSSTAYGADLRWQDADTAVVEYLRAKSVKVGRESFEIDGRLVTLLLREGTENPDAPAGGMARD
ncbi:hypothetical protein LDO32_12850 [Luteimonas sp. Y-2-2-4F]|nr:hypothetical protein [Luteimonas sp. Y-2-2-4F]MCD9032615.1 hypothetical protein [Luteimonas sp. Y-2-2-4F]